jgi:four helix bundle protein
MAWKTYDDLDVFKKSYALALNIHLSSAEFPKEELFSLTSQIRRSSKGICANIAEGHGKSSQSTKEFIRFLSISIGSAEETRLWLKFCKDLNYIAESVWKIYDYDCTEIIKMLHGLIKSLHKENVAAVNY